MFNTATVPLIKIAKLASLKLCESNKAAPVNYSNLKGLAKHWYVIFPSMGYLVLETFLRF